MSDIDRHPVSDSKEHSRTVSEYRRDGYEVVESIGEETIMLRQSYGSLLSHLALFFTIGWLSLGYFNLIYALHRRYKTRHRVQIITRPEEKNE